MPRIKLTEKAIAALPPAPSGQVTWHDTEVSGFVLVVGKKARTFAVKTWVGSRKRKIGIGRHGAIRKDGHAWTATLARQRAKEILGEVAGGAIPERQTRRGGPTLRDGLELHTENMRKKRRSERSIRTLETELEKYLADWLDRPIAELTGAELEAVCKRLMAKTKPRAGSVNPPGAALTKRLVAQVSACWNALDRLHDLPGKNPAKRVTTHALAPKRDRVPDAELPAWLAKVEALSPVRRDLQLLALFTGLRSESARTLRWEDVDRKRGLLHVRRAKGDRPYTVPLVKTHLEILERREKGNAIEFKPYGGDAGWIFPTLSRARPFRVQPVTEAKERRRNEDTGQREKHLPGLHPLRKTYNSIAIEIGVARQDREALMNHEGQGVNVAHYGFPERWDHLAACQKRIEAAIWERLKPKAKAKRKRGGAPRRRKMKGAAGGR